MLSYGIIRKRTTRFAVQEMLERSAEMKELTPKQQQVYNFIVKFTSENGYPPSIREICASVNLKSPSSVHAHLKTLQNCGYIEKDTRKTRALTVPTASLIREHRSRYSAESRQVLRSWPSRKPRAFSRTTPGACPEISLHSASRATP